MRLWLLCLLPIVLFSNPVAAEDISEDELRGHIAVLASNAFGGRKPGTEGENKTVNYIATAWQAAGLEPAGEAGSWYAPVTLTERTPLTHKIAMVRVDGERTRKVRISADGLILRGRMANQQALNMELVHAGHGGGDIASLAPFVSGKLVLLNLLKPEGITDFPGIRERRADLIAAGAAGVLTVIENEDRYARAVRRYRRASLTLGDSNIGLTGPAYHAGIEGLISGKQVSKLLAKIDIDAKQFAAEMQQSGAEPRALGLFADISVDTRVRTYQSHNVVGKIAGRRPEQGALLFLGHWDHLGVCRGPESPDRICNGAVDNASGIALLIETARRLARDPVDRDIYFLATTAEESGLLGARAFAANPGFALDRLVAVFNADTVALSPEGGTIAVVGRGETDLDADMEVVAAAEGRVIDKSDKANAFLRRQDGYVFLEKDIPAFMITSAFADQKRLDAFLASRYHDVGDELDDELVLGGAAADANFHVALGRYFGNLEQVPGKGPSEPLQN